MKRIFIIFRREFSYLLKKKGYLILLLGWPLLAALLLGGIFSEKVVTQMPLGLIDDDQSSLSRTLIRYVEASRSFNVAYRFEAADEIKEAIYSHKIVAGLYIPKNFEKEVKTGKGQSLILFVDGANLVTANLSIAEMKAIVGTISAGVKLKLLKKLGYTEDRAMSAVVPIKMDVTKNFNPGTNYLNYMPPGTWMALLHQLILLFASLVIIREKENQTFSELLSLSNHNWLQLTLGKLLIYFVVFFIYFEIFYRLLFPLFGIEFKGNYQLMFFISSAFLYCTLGLGYLISAKVSRSIDAIKAVLLIGPPAFLISGYSWPLAYMPWFTKVFSYMIPLTYFIDAYRSIYQQGGNIRNVWFQLIVLLSFGTICFVLSYYSMKKTSLEKQNVP